MSCNLSVFVGTFLEVPNIEVEKVYKVNKCPICNTELKSPYCPKCGTAASPVVSTKLELLDISDFLEEHDICASDFMLESRGNGTYIIDCGEDAGVWLDTGDDCNAVPLKKDTVLYPYLEIMQLFDDEKVPYNVITGAFTYWG